MAKSMEEILGNGAIATHRIVPGTEPGREGQARYVAFPATADPKTEFRAVMRKVDPPLATNGGVVLAGCIVILPSGEAFYAITFHGDVKGWQRQIELGAERLGLISARIEDDILTIADGRTIALADCAIRFD